VRRRRPRGPAPARRRAGRRPGASAAHRRAAGLVARRMTLRRPDRASPRAWAGGAVVAPALLAFGLARPADGSPTFFVLRALAAAGYLATLYQVANGLRPSPRALAACAVLALVWRIPMLLAPPEPAADLRRYVWDANLVRAGLSPYAVVPADPAFASRRTSESRPVNPPDGPRL